MMKAAVCSANEESVKSPYNTRPKILAITILTSINDSVTRRLKINNSVENLAIEWAILAKECGLDGIVSSVHEVKKIKEKCGNDFITVTPGIRVISDKLNDDQQRVGTPELARDLGSSAIVVGRPIMNAEDRVEAAREIKRRLR